MPSLASESGAKGGWYPGLARTIGAGASRWSRPVPKNCHWKNVTIDHLSQTSFKIFKKSMAWVGSKHLKSDYSLLQRHLTCSQELRQKNLTMTDNWSSGSNWFQAVWEELPIRGKALKLPLFLSFLIVTTSASGNNRNSLLAQEESSKSRWGVTKSRIPGVMHCSAWRVGPSLAEKKNTKRWQVWTSLAKDCIRDEELRNVLSLLPN